MYDLLTCELPTDIRSREDAMTLRAKRADLQMYDLSCMQLAGVLGDHSMLRHILRKQCQVDWTWGRLTQFSLDLEGIDSAGVRGHG